MSQTAPHRLVLLRHGQSEWNAKHLDAISDEDIMTVDIPNGTPLLYHLGPDMRPVTKGRRYLSANETNHARTGHPH